MPRFSTNEYSLRTTRSTREHLSPRLWRLCRHLHLDLAHRLVPNHLKVLRSEPIDPSNLLLCPLDVQRRELARFSLELRHERLDVVLVDVRVTHLEDKLVRFRIGHQGDHVGEERVGCDVEGNAEAEVT
jgi:hypothetical protein